MRERFLVPFDLSDESIDALRYGASLSRARQQPWDVLCTIDPPLLQGQSLGAQVGQLSEARRRVTALVHHVIAEHEHRPSSAPRVRVEVGDAAKVLRRVAPGYAFVVLPDDDRVLHGERPDVFKTELRDCGLDVLPVPANAYGSTDCAA